MSDANGSQSDIIKTTSLHDRHVALGAKIVPFTGYSMPLNYPTGILAEHLHTRESASLFDVSHMGQISIWGEGAAHALEWLVPGDIIDPGEGDADLTTIATIQAEDESQAIIASGAGAQIVIRDGDNPESTNVGSSYGVRPGAWSSRAKVIPRLSKSQRKLHREVTQHRDDFRQ